MFIKKGFSGWVVKVVLSSLINLLPGSVTAQAELPTTERECINDHAGVVGQKDLALIDSQCRKAAKEKVSMMVLTVSSVADFRPRPRSVDQFVGRIFDDWDTGYEAGKDALLLFIVVREKEVRILMGDRYADFLRKKASSIIHNVLVPRLRRKQHSRGIREAHSRLFNQVVKPHIQALKKSRRKANRQSKALPQALKKIVWSLPNVLTTRESG